MKAKRTKKVFARVAAALLSAALVAGAAPHAAAQASRVVRIPCGFNDFLRVEDGGASGYYAEYLERLAETNGWEYEYVEASWPETMDLLENGEIDLLYPVNYSAERDEFMDFSELSCGYTSTGLFALSGSGYYYEDYASFDGARIACVSDSSNHLELEDFAKKHGFSFEIVYLNTTEELVEALKSGRVELAVSNAVSSLPGCALVAIMEAMPVYLVVREGNAELLREIDVGMHSLLATDGDMVTETVRKTLDGNEGRTLAYTREEQALVDSMGSVKVGFYTHSAPLAYMDEDGAYGGVYLELLKVLDEKSGLEVEPYPISPDKNWKELLKTGEIDFYIGASDVIVSKDDDIVTSDAFMEYSNTLVTRSDCAFNRLEAPKIAITYGRANWGAYMKEHLNQNLEIQYYQTAKECMLAVAQGKADASLVNHLEFNYQSKNPRLSGLIQWSTYRFPTEVSLAVSDSADAALLSVVNKALEQIPSDHLDAVKEEYLNMPYDSFSAGDILYSARIPLIIACCVMLLAAAVILMASAFRRNRAAAERRAKEREQNQLQILAVMSRDYLLIAQADLDEDSFECLQLVGEDMRSMPRRGCYSDTMRDYMRDCVAEDYLDELLPLCEPGELIRRFQSERFISVRYEVFPGAQSGETYEVHLVSIEQSERRHRMAFGIRCVDSLVQEEQKRRRVLRDALDSANMANAAKSEFLSRMSHDIRTPMNAIIGMTAIAATHADDPVRVRDALGKISGASRYLLSLINDVLDMSKIESGRLALNEENIDLSELIGETLEIISPRAAEHKHTLKVSVQNVEHEALVGDSLRLQQVLVNILDNAVKYTPDGGNISLTVREIPVSARSSACYEFVIKDDGIGMSEEFQEHIFEPFLREEDLRTSKIQGTGLGMSITNNIVQMMNGSIKVESEPGKGSTFTVTLFLRLRETADADLSELADIPVLVADDDGDALESVCAILCELGMAATGCGSGREAVEAVRRSVEGNSERFYAVVLDWKMPETDGVEAARAIRRIAGDDLPIIILSAYDWTEIEEEARAAGVDAFLSKPVFKSGIIRLFRSLADKRDAPSAALEPPAEEDFGGARVLLVEDNALNREIAKEILEMEGLSVDEAEDGQIALDRFSASAEGFYKLIIMDIQMPNMNGYETTAAIRALDRADARSVPIVAMTANAFVEDIQKSKSVGMNDHLAKPIDVEKLNRVLRKYLG